MTEKALEVLDRRKHYGGLEYNAIEMYKILKHIGVETISEMISTKPKTFWAWYMSMIKMIRYRASGSPEEAVDIMGYIKLLHDKRTDEDDPYCNFLTTVDDNVGFHIHERCEYSYLVYLNDMVERFVKCEPSDIRLYYTVIMVMHKLFRLKSEYELDTIKQCLGHESHAKVADTVVDIAGYIRLFIDASPERELLNDKLKNIEIEYDGTVPRLNDDGEDYGYVLGFDSSGLLR